MIKIGLLSNRTMDDNDEEEEKSTKFLIFNLFKCI